ncbi:hypothetical protein NK8_29000 [Caballeronia sp. NK8]|nr:hypothetical protein NK8_29000 [Caballeronia sp. NK8]
MVTEISVAAITTRNRVISADIRSEKEIQKGLSPSDFPERLTTIRENMASRGALHALKGDTKLLDNAGQLLHAMT